MIRSSPRSHRGRSGRLLAAILATGAFALSTRSVQARFVFTLQQVGPDVVVTGSGTLNLTGLSSQGGGPSNGGTIQTSRATLFNGTGSYTYYTGLTGPASFGSGGLFNATATSGNVVGIGGASGVLFTGGNFTATTQLSTSETFANQTLATLGFTPGTYTYTWSSDSLVVTTGNVPEPGTWALLATGMGLGLATLRRHLASAATR